MTLVLVLECVARFLYDHGPHVDLVPLLPVCTELGAWNTTLQDFLDNTVRLVARHNSAWAVGQSTVMFLVRTGRRPRRGHGQPIGVELIMAELGYLPWPVFETMSLRGVFWEPARSERLSHSPWIRPRRGDGSANNVPWRAPRWYWCMHVMGHYTWGRRLRSRRPSPTRRTPKASDEPGWNNLDGARPSPQGIFCGRGLRKNRCATVSAELCGFPVIGARGQWQSQQRKS